ncbi:MAG: tryptophan--tRNA ligase [Holosporales bacterium]|jgi:tryptophanyl-tRNA synthetase|nr:tryptophan--tRNA ligase [Holosporales bacterium]
MSSKKIVLTGDRPTGHLHLGHYVGSLKNRVLLQDKYDCFFMIADTQALSDNFDNPQKVVCNIEEVCKDYLAAGIDPCKCVIFVQSLIPELFELTIYYMNLISVARLERNPTVKSELQQKAFSNAITAGFLCYPVSQAADITAFKASLVPVGEDQLPLIEASNEIVRRFNRIYDSNVLVESQAILGKTQRLIGIDGKAKACKSLGNAIFLSDSSDVVEQKIRKMYTDPEHIKVSSPGKIEGNVVFSYLDAFFEDKEELESLKKKYRQGGLGDSVLKSLLNDTLQNLLNPIREKRESIDKSFVKDILSSGSKKAGEVAKETLREVRSAMGLNYGYV